LVRWHPAEAHGHLAAVTICFCSASGRSGTRTKLIALNVHENVFVNGVVGLTEARSSRFLLRFPARGQLHLTQTIVTGGVIISKAKIGVEKNIFIVWLFHIITVCLVPRTQRRFAGATKCPVDRGAPTRFALGNLKASAGVALMVKVVTVKVILGFQTRKYIRIRYGKKHSNKKETFPVFQSLLIR
jgi:hypothetical protein